MAKLKHSCECTGAFYASSHEQSSNHCVNHSAGESSSSPKSIFTLSIRIRIKFTNSALLVSGFRMNDSLYNLIERARIIDILCVLSRISFQIITSTTARVNLAAAQRVYLHCQFEFESNSQTQPWSCQAFE
jgi:hypothetical protein